MTNKSLLHLIENEQYQLIVENSADLITTLDTNRKILYISPSCFTLLGYTREELVGLDVTTYVHPEDKQQMISDFKNALKGQVQPKIFRIRHKDGSWRYFEVSEGVLLIEAAQPYGLVAFARDVTSRIQNEKRKNEFIAILSHDLKTPLTTIVMLMSFLEKKVPPAERHELSSYYSKLEKEITHFSQLVHMLIDVSAMEQGILHLEKEKFLLNDFIKKSAYDQISEREHKIIVQKDKEETVYADKKRLGEVVNILFSNAVKYSASHMPIAIGIEKKDNLAEVSITDYGKGIPTSDQQKIFEKFYQVEDPEKYSRSGIGVGLYFAKEIITMHEGKLWVKSVRGKGSTFYFSLPTWG